VNDFFSSSISGAIFLNVHPDLGAGLDTTVTAPAFLSDQIFQRHRCSLVLQKYKFIIFFDNGTYIDTISASQASSISNDMLVAHHSIIHVYAIGEKAHACHRAAIFI
jgi:hypothetical protein